MKALPIKTENVKTLANQNDTVKSLPLETDKVKTLPNQNDKSA